MFFTKKVGYGSIMRCGIGSSKIKLIIPRSFRSYYKFCSELNEIFMRRNIAGLYHLLLNSKWMCKWKKQLLRGYILYFSNLSRRYVHSPVVYLYEDILLDPITYVLFKEGKKEEFKERLNNGFQEFYNYGVLMLNLKDYLRISFDGWSVFVRDELDVKLP